MFRSKGSMGRALSQALMVLLLPLVLFWAAGGLGGRAAQESLEMAEQSIRRAAVQCYALEGAYPTALEDLQVRYGVTVDEKRYFVDYRYVASNLMPDIAVLPLSGREMPAR